MHDYSTAPAASRRFVFMMLAVAGILIGLLAMHTLQLSAHDSHAATTPTASVASAHGEHAALAPAPATLPAESCEGDCAPSHSMTAMACVLAILVTMLLLKARLNSTLWAPLHVRRSLVGVLRVVPRPRAAPSILLLSISRT